MGIYYFQNATLQEENKLTIPGIDTSSVANLENYPDKEIEEFFRSVIKINGWHETDRIVAYPDDNTSLVFAFENGSLSMYDQEEDISLADQSGEEVSSLREQSEGEEESFDFYNENVDTEEEETFDFYNENVDTEEEEEEFLSPAMRESIERLVAERVAIELKGIRKSIEKEIFASLRERLL